MNNITIGRLGLRSRRGREAGVAPAVSATTLFMDWTCALKGGRRGFV